MPIIVDPNGHLMGAMGMAILAKQKETDKVYNLNFHDISFVTKGEECNRCSNHCEILRIYKDDELVDAWGSKCHRV